MKRIVYLLIILGAFLGNAVAFRDLETGTFLTRDPIRYGDGPNMYCYVSCNPITRFDALGLWGTARSEDADGNIHIQILVTVSIVDCQSNSDNQYPDEFKEGIAADVKSVIESTYAGQGIDPESGKNVTYSMSATVNFKDSVDDVKDGDITSMLVDSIPGNLESGFKEPNGKVDKIGGYEQKINMGKVGFNSSAKDQRDTAAGVIAHELGHNLGLHHPNPDDPNNTSKDSSKAHDDKSKSTSLSKDNVMRTWDEKSGLDTDAEQAVDIDEQAEENATESKEG